MRASLDGEGGAPMASARNNPIALCPVRIQPQATKLPCAKAARVAGKQAVTGIVGELIKLEIEADVL